MNASPARPLLASLVLLLAPPVTAQTWIGGTSANWDDAANWDTGIVPDGPAATATFTAAGLNPQYNTDIALSADRTLAGIVFAPNAGPVTLQAGNGSLSSLYALVGIGLKNSSAVQQRVWLTTPAFNFTDAITLTFRNQATVAGDVRLIAIGEDRGFVFRDQSSAGSANFTSYHTDFFDHSTAGNAIFDPNSGGIVTFHDQSTAGAAKLPGNYGAVIFADSSTAGNATIVRPDMYGSSTVSFRDHSTAGTATLSVYSVDFSGFASAGQAHLNTAGVQYYSSHGMYATQFATTTFHDLARAGDAVINVNSVGSLNFTGFSSAENATITSTGEVTFSGRASLGSARLNAGTGPFYVNQFQYYNQAARLTTVGRVTFKDQATGGDGVIAITAADTVLDFSGLHGNGTTGRAALPANPSGAAIVADDVWEFSLSTITNSVPGGTIYLGSTRLGVGLFDTSMTLSALIQDTGGAYGSAAGEQLQGGSLGKVGTGTLTIANPNNDYTGVTLVTAGTLNLAGGGRINDATIDAPARLTGNGTVRGFLVNAGTVSPGNSAGTITVTGNYVQDPLGTLQIELLSSDVYDRVIVGGNATLAGTLNLSVPAGFLPVGNTAFDFLTANSITGTFTTVTSFTGLGAALSSQLVYTPNGVRLQVAQHPFAGFGTGSPAAAALGAHFDATLAGSTGSYRDLIAGLNTLSSDAALATALAALAPDRYSTLAENSFLSAAVHQAAQDRRFAAWRADLAARGLGVFFEGGQHRTQFDAAPGLAAAESTLAGGTGGLAWTNRGFTFGAAVTQESGDADLDHLGSRADLESTAPAVFLQYAGEHFFISAAAAFSQDDYDLRRRIVYPGTDLTATAQTSGTRNDFAVSLGRSFHSGAWSFTPQAGVLASRWQLDGFTETGADGGALTLPDQSLRSLRTRVGVDVVAQNPRFAPRLSVAWLHETEDDRSITAAFAGGGTYAAPGRPPARDLVQASLGFDWRVGRKGAFYATLAGAWGDGASVTTDFSAGFRWQF